MRAKVVGGLQVVDGDEADDKIIAVMANDNIWAHVDEVTELPQAIVERLHHYFATYKNMPDKKTILTIEGMYGSRHAHQVVQASLDDYDEAYGR